DSTGRVHHPAEGARARHRLGRARGRSHSAAADPHDIGGDDHGRGTGRVGRGGGLRGPETSRIRDRRGRVLLDGADAVRRARRLHPAGPLDGAKAGRGAGDAARGGGLMLALLAALQFQLQAQPIAMTAVDSLPVVTLSEALRRATGLDPNYVAALGQVDNAVWARRSAFSVFILPSVTVSAAGSRLNPAGFNFLTGSGLLPTQVTAQLNARYDLFLGGQKLAELSRSGAALEAAHAGELVARFAAAQLTESDYYAVLADAELLDTTPAPDLPITLAGAINEGGTQGPQYRVARANERAAGAAFRARLGDYLPHATLTFNALAFDTLFFPKFFKQTTFTLGV